MTRSSLLKFTVGAAALAVAGLAGYAVRPASAVATKAADVPFVQAANDSIAGEYLVVVASCHDCHTAGWVDKKGNVPDSAKMAGNPVGYYGPWGTAYAKNLRQIAARQSEDHWVQVLRTADGGEGKLPMPWHDSQKFSEKDMRAMYRYVKSLGPQALRLPRGTRPGTKPTTGYYIDLTVKDSTGN